MKTTYRFDRFGSLKRLLCTNNIDANFNANLKQIS